MKKQPRTRLMALGMALLLLTLSACAAGLASSDKTFETPLELSISCWTMDPSFLEKGDPIYDMICEKFNITINPFPLTYDDYTEKTQMWIAVGEMPDIHQTADNVGSQSFVDWCRDGLLMPMPDDLAENYPNLAVTFDRPDVQATKIDGKFYMIPMWDVYKYEGGARMMIVRKDWMNTLGLEKPRTFDEFVEFLKAFRDADPAVLGATEIIPLSLYPGFTDVVNLAFTSATSTNWVLEDGIYKPVYMTQGYYEALKAWRLLYKEGLLDRDIAINKTDDVLSKFIAGKMAVYTYQVSYQAGSFHDAFLKANPEKTKEDCLDYIYQLENQDGNTYLFQSNSWWGELFLNANMSQEKQERCLSLLDYMMTDEWRTICRLGIEGEDYIMNGSEIEVLLPKDENGAFINLKSKYSFLNGFNQLPSWGSYKTDLYDDAVISVAGIDAYTVQIARDAFTWAKENTTPSTAEFAINFLLSPKKMEFKVDLNAEWMKFVLGEGTDEALYAEFIAEMQRSGIDDVIAEVNAMMKDMGY